MSGEPSTLLLCARIRRGSEAAFGQWQVSWQAAVLASGAETVEFWPPAPPDQLEAVILARFPSVEALRLWRRGKQHQKLIEEAEPLVEGGLVMQLVGQAAVDYSVRHGVTMVMVTEIKPRTRGGLPGLGRAHPEAPGDLPRLYRLLRPAAPTE